MTPKEIGVRWFEEVWNNRNVQAIPQLLAEHALGHLEGGKEIVGPQQFIDFQISMLEALPDVRIKILNSLSDGDDACILWEATANHTGHGLNLQPTNRPVKFRGMSWLHIEDGKIVEGWDSWDLGSLMQTMTGASGPGSDS
jgi:predicted ester cyclase